MFDLISLIAFHTFFCFATITIFKFFDISLKMPDTIWMHIFTSIPLLFFTLLFYYNELDNYDWLHLILYASLSIIVISFISYYYLEIRPVAKFQANDYQRQDVIGVRNRDIYTYPRFIISTMELRLTKSFNPESIIFDSSDFQVINQIFSLHGKFQIGEIITIFKKKYLITEMHVNLMSVFNDFSPLLFFMDYKDLKNSFGKNIPYNIAIYIIVKETE